ncbi:hypothetical protein FEM48_ZijujUnG0090500 [Ziziphus jujuba var. spinosa]|uniref:Kinesin motor domain-containing protein n=1 Tax=Ziziphus jujuba var. spinosa TaxID=714518 RepID=A0A978U8J2_ZIZJJ|nr:hypothetical protein FEM48_ZijujUnG0090500 [Ziziphus jujuba var. spinosa]
MEASENCCVKVAVHIRPLIGDERLQGCKECVTVTNGKPQIQIGTHSFTFDHVYGSNGAPSSSMFEECIAPLVDGLFQGYNATVLAYGQTGSGKTYTMGTGSKDGCQKGLIPQVMNALFNKIELLKHQTEFHLHVSFIEILKEEVRDLLDSVSVNKVETPNGHAGKVTTPGRQLIQIRETSNGAITLAGSTEVSSITCIFTITLEQMRKINSVFPGNDTLDEDMVKSIFVQSSIWYTYYRGLLALGNVISAWDSLGGNSKTVMIACISPADINAEKVLTLLNMQIGLAISRISLSKFSDVLCNRDLISNEMQLMRQQLKYLQAELCARGGVSPSDEVQQMAIVEQFDQILKKALFVFRKVDGLKRGFHSVDSPDYRVLKLCQYSSSPFSPSFEFGGEADLKSCLGVCSGRFQRIDEAAKEWEHEVLQSTMDRS